MKMTTKLGTWRSVRAIAFTVAAVFGLLGSAWGAGAVDPSIASYEKVSDLSGNMNGVGSDTLNNLMQLWGENFHKVYPNVNVQYEGKGSATAPPALIEGAAQLGPMSRAMNDKELDSFEKKYGYKPTRVTVALDCLSVWVNKDNPIKGLTMQQVDCIFSATRKSGFAEIKVWGGAGLTGNWEKLPITLYGRNSVSGTYAYFKEHALLKGDFKDTVKELPGTAAVVNAVAGDKGGIGYGGVGYTTADVRALPLARNGESPLVGPTFEDALKGTYPLGRALYIYVNKKRNEPLAPAAKEFLRYVLSKEGQEIVVKEGFDALPPKQINEQRQTLE
jgi:phosphate transport system substrate-binding protein